MPKLTTYFSPDWLATFPRKRIKRKRHKRSELLEAATDIAIAQAMSIPTPEPLIAKSPYRFPVCAGRTEGTDPIMVFAHLLRWRMTPDGPWKRNPYA